MYIGHQIIIGDESRISRRSCGDVVIQLAEKYEFIGELTAMQYNCADKLGDLNENWLDCVLNAFGILRTLLNSGI